MTDRDLQIYELEALESVLREKKLAKSSDWSDKNAEIQGIIEVKILVFWEKLGYFNF